MPSDTDPRDSVITRPISRRRFLQASTGAAAAWALAGCAPPEPSPTASVEAQMPGVPFGIWAALRTAVRRSPDHLRATADRLVEAKDPAAIHAFVRDEIATCPPPGGAELTEVLWGTRATLRGGVGTPREKAELLASLYRRAGFDAEVVTGEIADTPVFAGLNATHEFALDVADDTVAAWLDTMTGGAHQPNVVELDPGGRESSAAADELLGILGESAASSSFGWQQVRSLPLVRLVVNGEPRFANPSLADVPLGESGVQGEPVVAPASTISTVEVALSVRRLGISGEPDVLVSGSWPIDELAGRQLVVAFIPFPDLETVASLPVASVPAFTAVLALQALDLSVDERSDRSIVGAALTHAGDVISDDGTGLARVNQAPLVAVTATADPGRVERNPGRCRPESLSGCRAPRRAARRSRTRGRWARGGVVPGH